MKGCSPGNELNNNSQLIKNFFVLSLSLCFIPGALPSRLPSHSLTIFLAFHSLLSPPTTFNPFPSSLICRFSYLTSPHSRAFSISLPCLSRVPLPFCPCLSSSSLSLPLSLPQQALSQPARPRLLALLRSEMTTKGPCFPAPICQLADEAAKIERIKGPREGERAEGGKKRLKEGETPSLVFSGGS